MNNDYNIDNNLQALKSSPAWNRMRECLVIAYSLNTLACQYVQEIEVLTGRFGIYHEPVERATDRLERAFDNFFEVIEANISKDGIKVLNTFITKTANHVEQLIQEEVKDE